MSSPASSDEVRGAHMAFGSVIPGVIAYFSMEIALEPTIPIYSGGLGVLAGDSVRAAADIGIPFVGVTLLYRKGYFRQHLDMDGNQSELPNEWLPQLVLQPLAPRVTITIEGRTVAIRAWRYMVTGESPRAVPVILLDTNLEENAEWDRTLTDNLYGGDSRYRLCQETVLGLGGLAMLRALGYVNIHTFHMNEGHSALLAVGLLYEQFRGRDVHDASPADYAKIQAQCVFTTHTPVAAGHDVFPLSLVHEVLGDEVTVAVMASGSCVDNSLNMTYLALASSRYANAVSMRHEEVSKSMFPEHRVDSITNGVHAATWTAPPFAYLFDRHVPEWRRDNMYLRQTNAIPLAEIKDAHARAKRNLIDEVERRTGVKLDPFTLTIGFARRATGYKRADLLFTDLERLKRIVWRAGPLQVIYGGKAHPHDQQGKELIRRVFGASAALRESMRVLFLEDYDMLLAAKLVAGVDLWLNTPIKPLEASGTSGMKAALNGVPSLSVLDGWWTEGHIEGVTGWSIGEDRYTESDSAVEAESIYDKLEYTILPMFYGRPDAYADVMRSAIAVNGSYFNAQRMMQQYLTNAYQVTGE
jgi:starch phosphorylase